MDDKYCFICSCGGRLFRSDSFFSDYVEKYICDSCDLEWVACDLCNGQLHAYGSEDLILDLTLDFKESENA